MKYYEGDRVKVYSLQSFHHGGFLCGEYGTVSQDQNEGRSVIVSVRRKIDGVYKIDRSYEVYSEQLRLVKRKNKTKPTSRFEIMDYDCKK